MLRPILLLAWLLLVYPMGLLGQNRSSAPPVVEEIPTDFSRPLPSATSGTLGSLGNYSLLDSVESTMPQIKLEGKDWIPNSKHALLWALIPGGGQIYNRKYWKLPLVWGVMIGCFYAIDWNQRHYEEYHAAYRDLKSENPAANTAWLNFAPRGTKPEDYTKMSHLTSTLKRGNDYFRRYRDLSIVLGVAAYGLSLLDAYVDAELYTFDISPDLSMRITPSVMPALPQLSNSYQMGVSCNFTF